MRFIRNLPVAEFSQILLNWTTVEAFLRKPRIDLVINFNISGVLRNKDIQDNEASLNGFFGDEGWKSILDKAPRSDSDSAVEVRRRLFREYYLEKIKNFKSEVTPKLLYTDLNAPLYYLIYVSPFPVGSKIWKDITDIKKYSTLNGTVCDD